MVENNKKTPSTNPRNCHFCWEVFETASPLEEFFVATLFHRVKELLKFFGGDPVLLVFQTQLFLNPWSVDQFLYFFQLRQQKPWCCDACQLKHKILYSMLFFFFFFGILVRNTFQ